MRGALVALVACLALLACTLSLPIITRDASATAPTVTAYGATPANAAAATKITFFLTYTDADNDAPTYVRVVKMFTTSPVYNLVANNSGDTTYTDGKQYYYDWYFFPYTGVQLMQLKVKSGADAEVIKNVAVWQSVSPTLTHQGVSPISNETGSFSFFVNYTSVFNYAPNYIRVNVDGSNHAMAKNNTTDVVYVDGVDYSFTLNLTAGNHTYSFHTEDTAAVCGEITNGVSWFQIRADTTLHAWISVDGGTTGPYAFSSTPLQFLQPLERYNYTPIWGDPNATLVMSTDASWLVMFNGTITGRPDADDVGVYIIQLTFSNSTQTAYQNYTVDVRWIRNSTPTMLMDLVLGLAFGFGLIILSVIDKRHGIWPTFAGLAWLVISVVAFYPIGLGWMVLGIGIGLIMWVKGTLEYAAGRKQQT
jgi:hypothetical protein